MRPLSKEKYAHVLFHLPVNLRAPSTIVVIVGHFDLICLAFFFTLPLRPSHS